MSAKRRDFFADGLGEHEPIATYRRALSANWRQPQTHFNLAIALESTGRFDEAIASYREAIAQRADFPEALIKLGNLLQARAAPAEAVEVFRRVVFLQPGKAELHYNLGNALQAAGAYRESLAAYDAALTLQPALAEAYYNAGNAYQRLGESERAIDAYQKAVQVRPTYAEAYNNLGNVLHIAGRLDEAGYSFRTATEVDSSQAEPWNNLGNLLKDSGRVDEALACYDRAMALQPNVALWHSHKIYGMHFCHGIDGKTILAEQLEWDRRHGRRNVPALAHSNSRDPERRIRLGYVSPDFREHVVGRNVLPLIREHDRDRFEVYCYADVPQPDALTERFQAYATGWRDIGGMSDAQLARAIRDDQIDILLDLSLHMAGNRLTALAMKPAPLQGTFAGYPGGTGLHTIDFRLTDPFLDPIGSDADYRERSIRLPDSFWCYEPAGDEPDVTSLPASVCGHVTFGCLNNFCKVNGNVLSLWADVLRSVAGSRLLLMTPPGAAREDTVASLARDGVSGDRTEFVGRCPRREYLSLYRRIDIGLDTFPYNGHTTSLDSYWMGVPVITLVGQTAVGRAGWSQLCNLGLGHLAALDRDSYVQIAVDVASDLPALGELRANLRTRMTRSPLTSARRFTENIERVYRQLWREWCERPTGTTDPVP